MIDGICLGNIAIDCDHPARLRDFYAGLLGWEPCVLFGYPAVGSGSGLVLLFMQAEVAHAAPTWPEEPGRQQKQMHFDFQVADVALAVRQAEALGARKAESQFGGGQYVTMLDPENHPFCLCEK